MKTYNIFIKESLIDKMTPKSDEDIRNALSQNTLSNRYEIIKRRDLDDSYLPTEEEIKNSKIEELINTVSKGYVDKKYLPPVENIKKELSTRKILDFISSGKLDKETYMPSNEDIKKFLSNFTFKEQVAYAKRYKLDKNLISNSDLIKYFKRIDISNRIDRALEHQYPIESIILDVNNEKYNSLFQKYVLVKLLGLSNNYLPIVDEIKNDFENKSNEDLKDIISEIDKEIIKIQRYKGETPKYIDGRWIRDYSFIPIKVKNVVIETILNKLQDSSIQECKEIVRTVKRKGVSIKIKDKIFADFMGGNDIIFIYEPYYIYYQGKDIEVYTEKEANTIKKIFSRYYNYSDINRKTKKDNVYGIKHLFKTYLNKKEE